MSTKSLPKNPTIRQLKIQAKDLHKAHKSGDVIAYETLRQLRRFTNSTEREICEAKVTLKDVQFAIALSYGFKGWEQLTEHVESLEFKSEKAKEMHCSFCGKNGSQVEQLIAGPGVYICNNYVNISSAIISIRNDSTLSEVEKNSKIGNIAKEYNKNVIKDI